MSNVRNKVKKEKKAKARREKARQARTKHLEERKAEKEREGGAPKYQRDDSRGGQQGPSSKPAGPASSRVHRTQGK